MRFDYDYQIYEFAKRKASYPIYLKFGINRFELMFLVWVSALLRHHNKQIANKDEIFSSVTGNSRDFRKFEGYLKGCKDKGFLGCYEYISRPGSISYGISDLGLKVLEMFEVELKNFTQRYRAAEVKLEEHPTSLTVEPAKRHRPVAA